jgi:transcriptional regulator with XRE-family HTH domain
VSGTSPVVRQRELGARLRALRNERGMTVEGVAAQLLCSTTKISRLETAARRPSLRDVRDLCVLYGIDESASQELMDLARKAREPGWWTEYTDLGLDPLIGLEQEATSITCFSMYYMPGLLQTEDYAEHIIKTVAPKMDPHVVQQRTVARMRRQEVLNEDSGPRYSVLLDEMVVRRGVGGPAIMGAQIDKVLRLVRGDRIAVQIIPFAAGAYAAADSYFVLMEFDKDSDLLPIVYIEGLTDNQYLQRGPDIARYRETIEYLRDRALDPDDSTKFLANARKKYWREHSLSCSALINVILHERFSCLSMSLARRILAGKFRAPVTEVRV